MNKPLMSKKELYAQFAHVDKSTLPNGGKWIKGGKKYSKGPAKEEDLAEILKAQEPFLRKIMNCRPDETVEFINGPLIAPGVIDSRVSNLRVVKKAEEAKVEEIDLTQEEPKPSEALSNE